MLSEKLRILCEQTGLPQRKVAAALDIDTATYCKIENGNYLPRKALILMLSDILKADQEELLKLWLVDRFMAVADSEKELAPEAFKIAQQQIEKQ